jgi:hypothetical protein
MPCSSCATRCGRPGLCLRCHCSAFNRSIGAAGAASTTPWRSARSACSASSNSSSATPWPAANPSMPLLSASGRAATPRPAPNGPSPPMPRAIRRDNPSSPAGPIRGAPNSVSPARAGRRLCACGGCARRRRPAPPNNSQPSSPTCQLRARCLGASSMPATIRSHSPKRSVRLAPPFGFAGAQDAASMPTPRRRREPGGPAVTGTRSLVMPPGRGPHPLGTSPGKTRRTAWCGGEPGPAWTRLPPKANRPSALEGAAGARHAPARRSQPRAAADPGAASPLVAGA